MSTRLRISHPISGEFRGCLFLCSLTVFACRGAAKDDFWVYTATGQEQYDFVVEKTKSLPAKYLTTIKRSDPQTCIPVLKLVRRSLTLC